MRIIKETKDIYFNEQVYHPERENLHKEIMDMATRDKGIYPGEPRLKAILLGGGTGSGKTQVIDKSMDITGFVRVDADKIKEMLPEYRVMIDHNNELATDFVHEESSDISWALLKHSIRNQEHILYDGTMANVKKYTQVIEMLRMEGYFIQMIFVDCDEDVALKRTAYRALDTGRFVDEEIVKRTNRISPVSFWYIKENADSYLIYRNNKNGQEPQLLGVMPDHSTGLLTDSDYDTEFEQFFNKANKTEYIQQDRE